MDAEATELGIDRAWALLQALARRAAAGNAVLRPCCLRLAEDGTVEEVPAERAWIRVAPSEDPCLSLLSPTDPAVERMLALYAPLCAGAHSETLVLGHVAQSLDGQIATRTGASRYITGAENLAHVHRLRALVDAVVVGAGTVEFDDPQLTTRLVAGRSPVRVVIDPNLRLSRDRRVFQDGAVLTLIVCAEDAPPPVLSDGVELVPVARLGDRLAPRVIAEALRRRGLRRLFIEGGGVTLSRFLEAGALDRLHVTIGPLFMGSGRPSIVLPGVDRVDQALRPVTRRFELGPDVLFDCRLTPE